MNETNKIHKLRVKNTTRSGAFLEWEPGNDLFLPIREQTTDLKNGDVCLVGLYVNEDTDELCATMYLYDLLSTESPYKKNDVAQGTVYNINRDLGVFVAVDDIYHGLVLNKELYGNFAIGDKIEVRIKSVREDGKLELSLRKQAHNEIESDAQKIMELLKQRDGKLSINDKSAPEEIKAELNISKAAFKRAAGRLLKEGAIKITDDGIELTWKN
ncbi:CvfB family protein [Desulfuribacillus alkaliarsenatis]|uniref:S1 motif domain-containing protein n=1 Tax=Desulfuribacillus alkaliarsenatis TaxID=766136 RepID=A0A1E5FZH6_9FIRM|nr:S1-like domain-containing RNA-binding protein [Desulfuribacillus alkaliarsenatis]OEF95981.1 hypothetical protein BHF68_09520 [Desulfuribacillus alkaliarsenatis]